MLEGLWAGSRSAPDPSPSVAARRHAEDEQLLARGAQGAEAEPALRELAAACSVPAEHLEHFGALLRADRATLTDLMQGVGESPRGIIGGDIRILTANCGVVDPSSLSEYEAHGGLAALRQVAGRAPIHAVLEPRSNTMKLGVMKDRLAGSLVGADLVFCYTQGLGWDAQSALAPLGERAQFTPDRLRIESEYVAQRAKRPRPRAVIACPRGT